MKNATAPATVFGNHDYARRITCVFDAATAIYELKFAPCIIASEQDAVTFFDALAARLVILAPPRDILFCLDNVELSGSAARRAYGAERARVANKFYRHSARYAGQPSTRVTVMTSGVVHRVEGAVYDTRADAVAAIMKARKTNQR